MLASLQKQSATALRELARVREDNKRLRLENARLKFDKKWRLAVSRNSAIQALCASADEAIVRRIFFCWRRHVHELGARVEIFTARRSVRFMERMVEEGLALGAGREGEPEEAVVDRKDKNAAGAARGSTHFFRRTWMHWKDWYFEMRRDRFLEREGKWEMAKLALQDEAGKWRGLCQRLEAELELQIGGPQLREIRSTIASSSSGVAETSVVAEAHGQERVHQPHFAEDIDSALAHERRASYERASRLQSRLNAQQVLVQDLKKKLRLALSRDEEKTKRHERKSEMLEDLGKDLQKENAALLEKVTRYAKDAEELEETLKGMDSLNSRIEARRRDAQLAGASIVRRAAEGRILRRCFGGWQSAWRVRAEIEAVLEGEGTLKIENYAGQHGRRQRERELQVAIQSYRSLREDAEARQGFVEDLQEDLYRLHTALVDGPMRNLHRIEMALFAISKGSRSTSSATQTSEQDNHLSRACVRRFCERYDAFGACVTLLRELLLLHYERQVPSYAPPRAGAARRLSPAAATPRSRGVEVFTTEADGKPRWESPALRPMRRQSRGCDERLRWILARLAGGGTGTGSGTKHNFCRQLAARVATGSTEQVRLARVLGLIFDGDAEEQKEQQFSMDQAVARLSVTSETPGGEMCKHALFFGRWVDENGKVDQVREQRHAAVDQLVQQTRVDLYQLKNAIGALARR